ncbi:uncharacterized protein LOC111276392 [Durio zibethinus]|uniref:Uncharacterized protein LOC111276392 n=1 Tax=Durio zibethinus TaxID=66656 RepID=A0A6P5WP05_DURZI|nr:uncharacterized protein LOC111276392 [Durio zibethinus]
MSSFIRGIVPVNQYGSYLLPILTGIDQSKTTGGNVDNRAMLNWEENWNTQEMKTMLSSGSKYCPLPFPKSLRLRTCGKGYMKKKRMKKLNRRMRRLRCDMEEISEEQKKIKEGQRQVREKFEAIELECEHLRKETNLIIQQSMSTQIRLALMFQILKARENQEFDKAAQLTCALREVIARENQQRNASKN